MGAMEGLARRAAERISREIILKKRLPRRVGGAILYVSPGSALRYWRPGLRDVDPALLDAACELIDRGSVVWDIGANVGLFAFAAAGLSGESGLVVSVEPDPFLAGLQRRSGLCRSVGHARVEVVGAAVSNELGLVQLCIARRGRSSNYVDGGGRSRTGGVRQRLWVPSVTLDSLLDVFPAPHVLKVDVEGHEALVFAGGGRLLAAHRPKILCEVGEENGPALTRTLEGLGYELFDADVPRQSRAPLTRAAWNTLAVPR